MENKRFSITVNPARCKKCGICVEFCPAKVLAMELNEFPKPIDLEKCTGCNLCYLRCPDLAIYVNHEGEIIR